MLQPREADIPVLFLVLVVLPLFTYVLLGMWNEAAKKKARITILTQVAAEEAFGVEATASTEIIAPGASRSIGFHICARCSAPAKTRCSRCKSVRYCSGNCQIAHWRQGHKDECREWVDDGSNIFAIPTSASQSIQWRALQVENSEFQGLADDNEKLHADISARHVDSPYMTYDATFDDMVVGASKLPTANKRVSKLNGTQNAASCYEETVNVDSASSTGESFSSTYKSGMETLLCSGEPHSWEARNHFFAAEPFVTQNAIEQSHISTGKMRKIQKASSLSDSSTTLPVGGNGLSDTGGILEFPKKDDVQESIFCTIGEASEPNLGAISNLSPRNIKYKNPPYTLEPIRASDDKTSGISHTNGPIAYSSRDEVLEMGDLEMAGPRKIVKAPKRNLMGLINYHKKIKALYAYEDLAKLFQCEMWDIYPRGLLNCGNSCYANAVLQCLTCTKPLIIYLLQRLHSRSCSGRDFCLMCELEQHVTMLREGGAPLSPDRILSSMRNVRWKMGGGNQEDAHEFLRLLVMSMQSICLENFGGEKKVDLILQETTLIQQLFGGRLRSKVKCLICGHESEQYENIMDLTLEIHGWIESLEDALTQFTASEYLDGENMYRCGRCSTYVKATKQLTVHEVPNILTIVLKRFRTGEYGKINKCVTFPDMLDMIPFVTGTADNPPLYVLYAVVVHLDTLNASFSGHYVSYVKDLHGRWFRIDDSEVQEVPLSRVMSEGAYMLFYSRSFPRPPRTYFEKPSQSPSRLTRTAWKTSKSSKQGHNVPIGNWPVPEKMSYERCDYKPQYEEVCALPPRSINGNMYRSGEIYADSSLSMEFSDATSSDWSLFTNSSDESSFTESTRNSFSTVDYGDSAGLDTFSCIFSNQCVPEYSHSNAVSCTTSSWCRPETRFFSENKGFVLDSGGVDKGRNS